MGCKAAGTCPSLRAAQTGRVASHSEHKQITRRGEPLAVGALGGRKARHHAALPPEPFASSHIMESAAAKREELQPHKHPNRNATKSLEGACQTPPRQSKSCYKTRRRPSQELMLQLPRANPLRPLGVTSKSDACWGFAVDVRCRTIFTVAGVSHPPCLPPRPHPPSPPPLLLPLNLLSYTISRPLHTSARKGGDRPSLVHSPWNPSSFQARVARGISGVHEGFASVSKRM